MRAASVLIALCSAAFALAGIADTTGATAGGQERYIVVMKAAKPGTPDVSDEEVATLGGTVLLRAPGRMVVTLPLSSVEALRNHERVKYLQRSVTGAVADSPAAERSIMRLHAGSTGKSVSAEGTPPTWQSGTYRYDGAGNVYAIGADPADADRRLYTYDERLRLTREATMDSGGGTLAVEEGFGYDPYGNMTTHTVGQTTTNYDIVAATNRFRTGTGLPYQYNEIGALTADGSMAYDYDAFGMLRWRALAGEPSPNNDFYLYTASDERIGARAGGDSWTWSIRDFAGQVLRQYQSSDAHPAVDWVWVEDYVYRAGLLASGERMAEEGGRREFHLDHLGSPRLVTGAAGYAMSARDFAPFGIQRGDWTQESEGGFSREEPLRFTGHERDFGLGTAVYTRPYLDYMHARYYSPSLARFLSVDQGHPKVNTPQTWNRYTYTNDDPLRYVDPDGNETLDPSLLQFFRLVFGQSFSNVSYYGGPSFGEGATIGHMLYFSSAAMEHIQARDAVGIGVLTHELSHEKELQNVGPHNFYASFVKELIENQTTMENYQAYRQVSTEVRAWAAESNVREYLAKNRDILATLQAGNALSPDQAQRIQTELKPNLYDIQVKIQLTMINGQMVAILVPK